MGDARSLRCVFMSHCLLAQGVMADGVVKVFPGAVKPILQFCIDNDINIMQMPCPESLCPAGGLGRAPHGKTWYERNGLRETSRQIAEGQAEYIRKLVDQSYEVIGIIGVEFSPACAVNYLNKGLATYKDEGIYVEELKSALAKRGLDIPFVGFNQRWLKKLTADLTKLVPSKSSSGAKNCQARSCAGNGNAARPAQALS